ncbi:hypothetical protein ACLOJK_012383 [Asimina triloba]
MHRRIELVGGLKQQAIPLLLALPHLEEQRKIILLVLHHGSKTPPLPLLLHRRLHLRFSASKTPIHPSLPVTIGKRNEISRVRAMQPTPPSSGATNGLRFESVRSGSNRRRSLSPDSQNTSRHRDRRRPRKPFPFKRGGGGGGGGGGRREIGRLEEREKGVGNS